MDTIPQSNLGDRVNYGLNGNGNGTIQNTSFHTSSITGDTLNHGFLQDLAGLGELSSENLYQYQNYGEMNGMNGISINVWIKNWNNL